MFHYSFSTVLMAALTSNLIIIIIALCLHNKKLMFSMGYKVFFGILLFTLVRCFLPFELPIAMVHNVYLPGFLSKAVTYLRFVFYKKNGIRLSVWILFEVVWLTGVVVKFIRHLWQLRSSEYFVTMWSTDVTEEEPYASLLSEVCGKRKNRFRVLLVPGVSTPSLYGIIRPRILLPINMKLVGKDLYYTLRHEVSHHYHHDLITKRVVSLLTIIYWWNPASYVLRNQVDMLLEMRIDDTLVHGDRDTTRAYLATLIHISEMAADESKLPPDLLIQACEEESTELTQRFEMMCNKEAHANIRLSVALLAIVFSIYLGSYLFTIENNHVVESAVQGTVNDVDEMYAVIKEDGTYDIYYGNTFIENRETVDNFIPAIPVYNQLP